MMKKENVHPELKFAVLAADAICFKIQGKSLLTLLGKVKANPHYPNTWAAIGGLVKKEETAEEAVERLLKEKAGLNNLYNEQLYTFSAINRDPRGRVVAVAYLCIARDNKLNDETKVETRWCDVETLPKLAYDHNEMIKLALERLRSKFGYTNIAQYFLSNEFTLSDLQSVYETVLGRGMDKRNFRKKILASGILKNTKKHRKEGVMRPATLYTFAKQSLEIVNLL